jgi:hypothetical protein
MDRNKDIDAKIRESFAASEQKAPEGLWAAMDQKLATEESRLDQEVKASFEAQAESAPEAIWSGINRQLTIDAAWKGINAYLNRRIFYRWSARIVALLILLFGLTYWGLELNQRETGLAKQNSLKDNRIEELEKPLSSNPTVGAARLEEKESLAPRATSGTGSGNTGGTAREVTSRAGGNTNEASRIATVEGVPRPSPQTAWSGQMDSSHSKISVDLKSWLAFKIAPELGVLRAAPKGPMTIKPKRPTSRFKHWELGLTYAYSRDFLSNNQYRESLNPRSLVASSPAYSHNFSLDLRYRLNPRWSLKAQWQPQNDLSLYYNTYAEGQYQSKQLQLQYTNLGFGLEHHLPLPFGRRAFNLVLGGQAYYGLLREASDESQNLKSRYGDAWGMQLNLGQEWRNGPLVLSYGIRTDFNFNNLYLGHKDIPAAFDRTWYRNWAFYLGSHYRF